MRRRSRARLAILVSVAALLASTGACGGGKAAVTSGAASSKCPDLTKADDVAAFDFEKAFHLSRDAADKLKAAALAAYEVAQLAEKLDAELGIACAQVAHDLGNKGDWRSGIDACAAAVKAVQEAKAKLGPKASVELVVHTPFCLVDATLPTRCASICDSSVPAERVKAVCQQHAGRCEGKCDGTCMAKGSRKCEGTCSGTCDAQIKGACGARCKGTCDGKPANGPCIGTCVGTCERGPVVGECKGECKGTCKLSAPGICDGVCSGACTVELTDAMCGSEFKPPDVSTDCRARCDLAVINQTACSPPQAGFLVTGAKDRETAEAMTAAVNKAYPGLLKILFEVGEKGKSRVLNAQAVIDGARGGFADMAGSGGKAGASASEKQLRSCFDGAFKTAAAAAASVKTVLDEATTVRDEATK